jgi:hypothetical protein
MSSSSKSNKLFGSIDPAEYNSGLTQLMNSLGITEDVARANGIENVFNSVRANIAAQSQPVVVPAGAVQREEPGGGVVGNLPAAGAVDGMVGDNGGALGAVRLEEPSGGGEENLPAAGAAAVRAMKHGRGEDDEERNMKPRRNEAPDARVPKRPLEAPPPSPDNDYKAAKTQHNQEGLGGGSSKKKRKNKNKSSKKTARRRV